MLPCTYNWAPCRGVYWSGVNVCKADRFDFWIQGAVKRLALSFLPLQVVGIGFRRTLSKLQWVEASQTIVVTRVVGNRLSRRRRTIRFQDLVIENFQVTAN